MFANTEAFSGFAVPDLEVAEKFYGETLGIATRWEMGNLVLGLAGGRDTFVYVKPNCDPATYTILNFVVDDIEEAVTELTAKGVEFERYEGFGQDELGTQGVHCTENIERGGKTAGASVRPESGGLSQVNRTFWQFSQVVSWWARQDLNLQPTDYESAALT